MKQHNKLTTVDEYINDFPKETQDILMKIRNTIKKIVPAVEESFSYGMPAYKTYKKPLVYFAAYKSFIGFYATPAGHHEFKDELSVYKQGKGSVQFPLNQPMPYNLIERIIIFRREENKNKYSQPSKANS